MRKMRGVGHEPSVEVFNDNDVGETEASPPESWQWKVVERGATLPMEDEERRPTKNPQILCGRKICKVPPPSLTKAWMAFVVLVPSIAKVVDPLPSPPIAEDPIRPEVQTKRLCAVNGQKIPGVAGKAAPKEQA